MRFVQGSFALTVCSVLVLSAPRGPNYEDLRAMGMGNTTVATTTDRTAIFHNPAGLGLLKEKIDVSIAPLGVSLGGPIGDIFNSIASYGADLGDFSKLVENGFLDTLATYDGDYLLMEYIPQVTIAKKNLGFGYYSTFPVMVRPETGHLIPKMVLSGQRDIVFTWAVGIPLKRENHHFGVSVEYLQRVPADEQISRFTDMMVMVDELSNSSVRSFGFIGDYAKVQHGASFDIGFMHDWSGFRLAWDVKDIFGVVGGDLVFPWQVDVGCAYFFPQLDDIAIIRNMIVAFEIKDLLKFEEKTGKYEHFLKKLHAGAEIDLNYVAFRGGISQGYPTAGAGISVGFVSLDYAYFTKELGYFPGQRPSPKHVLSLSFALRVNDPDWNRGGGAEQAPASAVEPNVIEESSPDASSDWE